MSGDKDFQLQLIEWEDAFGCSPSWGEIKELEVEQLICRSVGWVVHEDERVLVVVPHLSQRDHKHSDQQGCGDMTIPISAVRSRITLKTKAK